jgi:hypothetical protein
MPEKKWRRLFFGLIIGSEIEPDLVTGFKMACIRYDRNPIAYFLADRYSLKRLTGNYGSTRLTRGSVDFPQARAKSTALPASYADFGVTAKCHKVRRNSEDDLRLLQPHKLRVCRAQSPKAACGGHE